MRFCRRVSLIFLGTSAGTPSKERALPSILVTDNVHYILLDVGEGVQYRLLNVGVSVHKITHILITHLHGDHIFGLPGLLASMILLDRRKELTIIGPSVIKSFVENTLQFLAKPQFPIKVIEVEPRDEVFEIMHHENLRIKCVSANHTVPSLMYVLTWKLPYGKFLPEKARELNIPRSFWSKLQSGEVVTLSNGRVVRPEEVTIPYRKREFTIVYTGDTAPTDNLLKIGNIDVLIHEATFKPEEDAKNVWFQGHSRSIDAAIMARKVNAKLLILTHISTRYRSDEELLTSEVVKIFPNTMIAKDLLKINFTLNTVID